MSGPPGSGKTMLARAMPLILPEMSVAEAPEVTKVYSVRGLLPHDTPLLRERPFRSPHHGTCSAGLIGGGSWPRPGEVSLAHRGVLFLDELPEFLASTLEVLRQPLDRKARLFYPSRRVIIRDEGRAVSTETRAPFRKIVGKTYPIVGEVVVRRTHGKQLYAVDGTRYTTPQVEERLVITIERDGETVGWAQVLLPPAPDPNAKPQRSADDATLEAELAEFFDTQA